MKSLLSSSLLSLACLCAFAAEPAAEISLPNGHLSYGFGTFSAKAYERVYAGELGGPEYKDYKLSQLDWRVKNAFTLNANADFRFLNRFNLNLSGWLAIDDSTDTIDDYDWEEESTPHYSDHSIHDCVLDEAYGLDASLAFNFLQANTWSLGLLAGYEYTKFRMDAVGGSYWYAFGTVCGNFPENQTVISYEQEYKAPYVGLVASVAIEDIVLEGRFKYSAWVNAQDRDLHRLRTLEFNEEADGQQYFSVAGSVLWNLTEKWGFTASLEYRQFDEERADLYNFDHSSGQSQSNKDGASIEASTLNFSLCATYTF